MQQPAPIDAAVWAVIEEYEARALREEELWRHAVGGGGRAAPR